MTVEGRTLEEQGVTAMRLDFARDTLVMTTYLTGAGASEVDRRRMPYVVDDQVVRLEPTSTVSGAVMRFRVRGDSLLLEVAEPADAEDVRILLTRRGAP